MSNKVLLTFLCAFVGSIYCSDILAWDDSVTHRDLSIFAAENSILNKNKGDYLRTIGFPQGLKEALILGEKSKKVFEWLEAGGELEDSGSSGDLITKKHRSYNHFHNPLKPWEDAGLDDWILIPPYHTTGESSLLCQK